MDGIVLDQIYKGFTLFDNVVYHENYEYSLGTEILLKFAEISLFNYFKKTFIDCFLCKELFKKLFKL